MAKNDKKSGDKKNEKKDKDSNDKVCDKTTRISLPTLTVTQDKGKGGLKVALDTTT